MIHRVMDMGVRKLYGWIEVRVRVRVRVVHRVRVRAVTLCPFCPLKCPFSPFETPFIEHFDNDVFFQFYFNFVISFLL